MPTFCSMSFGKLLRRLTSAFRNSEILGEIDATTQSVNLLKPSSLFERIIGSAAPRYKALPVLESKDARLLLLE